MIIIICIYLKTNIYWTVDITVNESLQKRKFKLSALHCAIYYSVAYALLLYTSHFAVQNTYACYFTGNIKSDIAVCCSNLNTASVFRETQQTIYYMP